MPTGASHDRCALATGDPCSSPPGSERNRPGEWETSAEETLSPPAESEEDRPRSEDATLGRYAEARNDRGAVRDELAL